MKTSLYRFNVYVYQLVMDDVTDFNYGKHATKQPIKESNKLIRQHNTLQANLTVTTIIAKSVTVSKFENNKLIPVGKYGLALAGDVKLDYYQLLLYGSKKSVLVNLVLTKDFKYNVNANNAVELLDKENWHLEFADTNDAMDFNSHMAFVLWKFNGPKELFWLDLYFPSRNDKTAMLDSIVEITYVAHVIEGKTLGPEVSNNTNDERYLKINVSEEGWEKSLLGVNDNTHRVVYIPVAKMNAWKILTDGRQCLCLTIVVKKVYEVKEHNLANLPLTFKQESLEAFSAIDNTKVQKADIVHDDISIVTKVVPTKEMSIEALYEEFEKLKVDNITTNKRLTQLEELIKDGKKAETVKNSTNSELKKSMKNLYKSIIQEFPFDQTFSGSQIQTKINDIFYNALMCSNQNQFNND